MRSKSYGDKQREAQRLKNQEKLWKKAHPEEAQASGTPNAGQAKQAPAKAKDAPAKPSA